ncbi:MAG: phosphatase PAP2 family protein [Verrucomicrobiota bacterium]|jgi:undecaprenyl-diphosphatase|nr:phosphatase PAP2 family protein [Verrucomicrobiota bacterium]
MSEFNLTVLKWLQEVRTPAHESFFLELTRYGEGIWILSVLGLLFWVFGARWAYRVAFAVMIGDLLTGLVKNVCCISRPWLLDDMLFPVADAGAFGFSFPSGHVANTTLLVGGLAAVVRRWWVWIAAVLWISLMGFSRMVLGVHTPMDVMGAILLASACIWGMGRVYDWSEGHAGRACLVVAGATALSLLVWAVLRVRLVPEGVYSFGEDAYRAAWATVALFVSWWVERTYIRFDPSRLGAYRLLAAALGICVLYLMIHNLRGLLVPCFGRDYAGYVVAAANPIWIFVVWPLLLHGLYRPVVSG